jgi:uncharacterized Rmd1/YagE family protein
LAGRAQIAERPEVLWEHPELDRLYSRPEAEFELGERARIVERKLDVIGNTASTLPKLVQERRSSGSSSRSSHRSPSRYC